VSRNRKHQETLRRIRKLEIELGFREPGPEDMPFGPGSVIAIPAGGKVEWLADHPQPIKPGEHVQLFPRIMVNR
jgi:hypothetical protein